MVLRSNIIDDIIREIMPRPNSGYDEVENLVNFLNLLIYFSVIQWKSDQENYI